MKLNVLKKLAAVAIFLYIPMVAEAWGVLGHRIVGEIAESHLQPNARKAIKQILGNETLAMSANWADFIKSDSSYNYLGPWHYVNLPEGLDKKGLSSFLDKFTEPNIYNKTNEMVELLKNPKTPADKKVFALRMLVHLIGDMHQPMHTARKEDLGGNRIYVTWFGQRSNLHRVWDEQLIDFQQLSYTEYVNAINFTTPEKTKHWNQGSIKDYIFESYEICNKIYAEGIKKDDRLSYKYNFQWIDTVNQQLLKGGIRLANILNEIYK